MNQSIEESSARDQVNGCLVRLVLYTILTIALILFVLGFLAGVVFAAVL